MAGKIKLSFQELVEYILEGERTRAALRERVVALEAQLIERDQSDMQKLLTERGHRDMQKVLAENAEVSGAEYTPLLL